MKRFIIYSIFAISAIIPTNGQTIYDYAMDKYDTLPFQNLSISIVNIDSVCDFYILYGIDSISKYKIITRKVSDDFFPIYLGEKYEVSLIKLNAVSPFKEQMPCDIFYNLGDSNFITNDPEYDCDLCITKEFFGKNYVTEPNNQKKYVQWIKQNPITPQSSRIRNRKMFKK